VFLTGYRLYGFYFPELKNILGLFNALQQVQFSKTFPVHFSFSSTLVFIIYVTVERMYSCHICQRLFVDVCFLHLQSAVALYKQYYSKNMFNICTNPMQNKEETVVCIITIKLLTCWFCSLFMLFCEIIIFKIILCEMSFLDCKYILMGSDPSLWFHHTHGLNTQRKTLISMNF